ERGRGGERERGRKGEGERGRKGKGERGRKGEGEKGRGGEGCRLLVVVQFIIRSKFAFYYSLFISRNGF
ncbi:hypothetical protein, partial [Baaleninema simplex]|uniref:hypothetical protein n=1 Tax=Baaleninema simplex TaxID=2862350 RepID=UPI00130D968E